MLARPAVPMDGGLGDEKRTAAEKNEGRQLHQGTSNREEMAVVHILVGESNAARWAGLAEASEDK